jgi:hypothetical protein
LIKIQKSPLNNFLMYFPSIFIDRIDNWDNRMLFSHQITIIFNIFVEKMLQTKLVQPIS